MGRYHKAYNSFYSSKQWHTLRDYVRSRDKVCMRCKEKGVVSQGVEVHHIKPIEKRPELALDVDNLLLLCRDCHNKEHNRVSKLTKFMEDRV